MAAETNSAPLNERRKYIVFDDPSLLGAETDITNSLISAKFSSGIDLATQLTLEIVDPNFSFARSNYFSITRDVYFKSNSLGSINESLKVSGQIALERLKYHHLEVSAVTCSGGPGTSPIWTIECRTKAIQQMRRDRNPGAIEGASQNYVITAGRKYGMNTVAETTSKSKNINKASNDRRSDSAWDVVKSLASEAKFITFESDGILFFASQKWMLGLWGSTRTNFDADLITRYGGLLRNGYNVIPVRYPSKESDIIRVHQMPQMRRSDNNPLLVEGSMVVDSIAGSILRPGMTIQLTNYPTFEGLYLISQVDYNVLTNDPATITFRSPEREDKDIIDYVVGATSPSTAYSN